MRLLSAPLACLLILSASTACSTDDGPAAPTDCSVHEECAVEDGDICNLNEGVCEHWGFCVPDNSTVLTDKKCPFPDLECRDGKCWPTFGVTPGGEGEGEAGGEGEGEGDGGEGPGGGEGSEGEGEAAGPGDGGDGGDQGGDAGGDDGGDRPPPELGDACDRHADCQEGRPDLTCKALGDEERPKICTIPCQADVDCPALIDDAGEEQPQCCAEAVTGGKFCGAAALCLDPTACFEDDNCPEGRVCFDRPDLGEDERRCHGLAGLGGACPGGFLDCNPDLTDRCIFDRDLRRPYCTRGCAADAEPAECPGWTCCGDSGFLGLPEEFACLNGGPDRCDIFGRDCASRDDPHDLVGQPDDDFEDARPLPDEGFTGILCPNDEDWSYVDVELGRSIFGDVQWTQPLGADRPSFAMRNADQLILAQGLQIECAPDADGVTETCAAAVSLIAPDAGRYYFQFEAEDDEDVTYQLSARLGCQNNEECRWRPAIDRMSCLAVGGQPGVCQDGFPCATENDCAGSRVCNQADLSCVEVCNPDRHEAVGNDDCGGPNIPQLDQAGVADDLTLCEDDADWFVIGLGEGDGLEVELDYARARGRLAVQIWSADCRDELRSSIAASAFARARLEAAPVGGNYYVRVVSDEPGSQNSYNLLHTVRDGGFCIDDEEEEDDFPGAAIAVPGLEIGGDPVTYAGRKGCEGDEDWYRVNLLSGELLSLFVDSPVGEDEGNLDVEVFGPGVAGLDQPPVAFARSEEAGEELHMQAPDSGAYYIRLHGGIDLEYTVRFERTGAPCEDDEWEPNDNAGAAEVLEVGADAPFVREARFCGGSDDWWRFFWLRRGGARIEVCVEDPQEGDLGIILYRAGAEDEQAVDFSTEVQAACEVIDVPRLPVEGDYTLKVFSNDRPQVPYTLTITLTEPCEDERFEPNDVNADSRELAPGDYPGLRRCDADEDWFHFAKPRDATLTVDVFTAADAPELRVELLNENGASVLSSPLAERPGQYSLSSLDSFFASNRNRYKVHIFSDEVDDIVDYELRAVLRPAPADCADEDPREPVDSSFIRASSALPDTYADQRVCAGDRDHWPVDLEAGQSLTATVSLTHADGDLTAVLYAPDGVTELDRSETDGDTEEVALDAPVAEAGRYVVLVEGAAAEVDNTYTITLTVE